MLIDAWMRPRTNQEYNHLAQDVARDEWHRWISRPKPYAIAMHVHAAVPAIVAWWFWGGRGLVGFWVTLAALYNMGDAIDSVSHLYGSMLPGQRDASRNSRFMGILILGEGWHANHHRFPWSAKHGLGPGQFDWTWLVIRWLCIAGLATDIRVPTPIELGDAGLIEEPKQCM
jgi:stearoyl-CoA desaturase (delta-9 desaturase)